MLRYIQHGLDLFDHFVLRHRFYLVCEFVGTLGWVGPGKCPESCRLCAYWKRRWEEFDNEAED